jgi:hypothetical protein
MLRTGGGELSALFQVPWRTRAAGTPVRMLLYCQIPDEPGMRAMAPEHRFLRRRGEQPVPGHVNTLAITTDISVEVKRRFLSSLRAGIFPP